MIVAQLFYDKVMCVVALFDKECVVDGTSYKGIEIC